MSQHFRENETSEQALVLSHDLHFLLPVSPFRWKLNDDSIDSGKLNNSMNSVLEVYHFFSDDSFHYFIYLLYLFFFDNIIEFSSIDACSC